MFGSSSTMRIRQTTARASGGLDQREPAREGQGEREAGALAGAARHPHAAAEVFDDPAADMQPQPAALRLAGERIARLAEFLEDKLLVGGADAYAVISHFHAKETALLRERYGDHSRRTLAELGRVGEEIEHHLHQAIAVGEYRRRLVRQLERHLDAPLLEQLAHRADRVLEHLAHVDLARMPLRGAGFDLGEVQHLVDKASQALRFLDDDAEELGALAFVQAGIVVEDLRERADRSERRAQLVSHGGNEVVLQAIELLQPPVGAPQLVGRRLQLLRFLLQLPAVSKNLRRLVDDVHHLVTAKRFLLDDRGDHDARGSAADRAGEQRLGVVHQVGISRECADGSRPAAARVGGKRLVCAFRAEKTAQQQQQAVDRGAAPPKARAGGRCRVLERIDEYGGLAVLGGVRTLDQRYTDVASDIGKHAPEQAVRDVVKSLEAEQLLRLEQIGAEQPVREESDRQPTRLGEGGQQQRVDPDEEPRSQTADRAAARAALPEDAADDGRRELRYCRERDQPNGNQRIGFPGEIEVEIAQHQDQHDRPAADA